VLEDVLAGGLKLVICGTAAGTRSAQLGHYYAGPGNKFWRTLAEVGLTPRRLAPGEATLLLDLGIGLTDVVKGQSGSDKCIRFDEAASAVLREKMLACRPRVLAFNGKRAAQEFFGSRAIQYGLQARRLGETSLFVAPSTSAAANASWDLLWWRGLAELVGGTPHDGVAHPPVASPKDLDG
jgi:double-stranded uracil-DNA glycosylase